MGLRAGGTLDGGCWVDQRPRRSEIGQTVDMASESCGVATGTEFHVSYKLADGSTMSMHYDNPFRHRHHRRDLLRIAAPGQLLQLGALAARQVLLGRSSCPLT